MSRLKENIVDKIVVVQRTIKPIWNYPKLKNAWNTGTRAFLLNSMGTDHFPIRQALQIGFKVESLPDYSSDELSCHGRKMLKTLSIQCTGSEFDYAQKIMVVGSQGNIGSKLYYYLYQMKCDLVSFDIALGHKKKDLVKMVEGCKAIFVCVPLNDSTREMFNEKVLLACRPSAPFIVNISGRMHLFNDSDLRRALRRNWISGYACDEVVSANKWVYNPKCYFTPHIGWKSKESLLLRERFLREKIVLLEEQLSLNTP